MLARASVRRAELERTVAARANENRRQPCIEQLTFQRAAQNKLLIRHIEAEICIAISVACLSDFGILLFKNAHLWVSHI
jgi:hypothetical protein